MLPQLLYNGVVKLLLLFDFLFDLGDTGCQLLPFLLQLLFSFVEGGDLLLAELQPLSGDAGTCCCISIC